MSAVAESVGHSMGGSSGALYQIFFVALAGQELSVAETFAQVFAAELATCLQKRGTSWWHW